MHSFLHRKKYAQAGFVVLLFIFLNIYESKSGGILINFMLYRMGMPDKLYFLFDKENYSYLLMGLENTTINSTIERKPLKWI